MQLSSPKSGSVPKASPSHFNPVRHLPSLVNLGTDRPEPAASPIRQQYGLRCLHVVSEPSQWYAIPKPFRRLAKSNSGKELLRFIYKDPTWKTVTFEHEGTCTLVMMNSALKRNGFAVPRRGTSCLDLLKDAHKELVVWFLEMLEDMSSNQALPAPPSPPN